MSTTLKTVLGVLLALVIIGGIGVNYLLSNLDSIVASIIETAGSEAAGVEVSVDSVEILLADGKGSIRGLEIGNPRGFASGYAVRIGLASVELDLESTGSELVVLKSVVIDNPSVNYEQQAAGSNLQGILDNLNSNSGSSGGGSADDGDAVKIIVDRFDFTNAQASVSAPALGRETTVRIPNVRLTGIGRKTSGVTASEAAKQVLEPIIQQTLQATVGVSEEQIKQQLRQEADQATEEGKRKATDKLLESLGGR
jgi:hypothetical protein